MLKRSDPPKPVSCSSSPTTGTTPTPYSHCYSAHHPPSSPVDDILHCIASYFRPSKVDERLIVQSRMSYPMQLISLTNLELRPIRCRRSGFPLAGNSPETPSVLEIPFKIKRSKVDHRLQQWNQQRRRLTNGSKMPPRGQPRHHLCSLSLISHPSPSTLWTSLPSASSSSPMRMLPPPLFSLILSFVGSPSPPSPKSSTAIVDLLSLPLLHHLAVASCSSPAMPLLLALVTRTCFCDCLFRSKRVCR